MNIRNKILIIGLILFMMWSLLKAQENRTVTKKKYEKRGFQVTFIYPLGTNGLNAGNYVNRFSFNTLAGYNAGTDGFELGGFLNINHDYMQGLQIGGFTNINGSLEGMQLSGFLNINSKKSKGAAVAGFANINNANYNGLQLSGFLNTSYSSADISQIAGFMNIVGGNTKGIQLSGFANLADTIKGVQVSSFINIAQKIKGLQLGIINISKDTEGIPIGLLSIVEDGYNVFEFSGGEALHTTFSYKLGVKHFYNIISFGSHFINGFDVGFGYGAGTEISLTDKQHFSIDIINYQINELVTIFDNPVNLSQVKFKFGYKMDKNTSVFVGPTYNLLASNINSDSYRIARDIAPYSFYNKNRGKYNYKMWIGINAGFRF